MRVHHDPDPVEAAAEELYSGAPVDFVARRTALATTLRAAGDKAGAKAVAALRRPTASAWLANLLVRERRDEVEQLLTLGEQLRTAQETLAGDALRQLGAQRRAVVDALVRTARELAVAAGAPATPTSAVELAGTLEAALADPQAARAVRGGRLVQPLSHAGFGPAASTGAATTARRTAELAQPEPTSPEPASPEPAQRTQAQRTQAQRTQAQSGAAQRQAAQREQAERKRAEQRVAEITGAERRAQEAAAAADNAQQAHEQARRDERAARDTLAGARAAASTLAEQLAAARSAVTEAEGSRQRAAAAVASSERAARQQHATADKARASLDRLRRGPATRSNETS